MTWETRYGGSIPDSEFSSTLVILDTSMSWIARKMSSLDAYWKAERPIQRRIPGADGDRTGEPRIGGGTGIIVIIIHFGRAHSYLRALHC